VIPPRKTAGIVHALLHHGPLSISRDDERMEIQLKPVRDGVVVNLRGESTCPHQSFAVQAGLLADRAQLIGRSAGMLAAPAAYIQAKVASPRIQSAFQGPEYRRRDPGRVPVHAHHGSERLEPEGIAETRQELGAPVVQDDTLCDRGTERGHPVCKPGRDSAAVQRQIGDSGTLHYSHSLTACQIGPSPQRGPRHLERVDLAPFLTVCGAGLARAGWRLGAAHAGTSTHRDGFTAMPFAYNVQCR
jgi:hypothetical protein